jgi:hypothetical protein
LAADERGRLFARFSSELSDPMLSSALAASNDSLVHDHDWKPLLLFQNLDVQLKAAGVANQQMRAYKADLKLNRLAGHFVFPPETNFLRALWSDFTRAPFLSQADLSRSPFVTTTGLQSELGGPRYARLRSLATFRYDSSFFIHRWEQVPYFHSLCGVPMIFLAGAAILFTVTTWVFRRDGELLVGTVYVGTLLGVGGLFAFVNCASTNFDARYLLPVYSCLQIALMLSMSILLSPLDSTIALEGAAPPSPRD